MQMLHLRYRSSGPANIPHAPCKNRFPRQVPLLEIDPAGVQPESARYSWMPVEAAGPPGEAGPPADFDGVHAGPGARRLARELGIDLTALPGTGAKGRITKLSSAAGFGLRAISATVLFLAGRRKLNAVRFST